MAIAITDTGGTTHTPHVTHAADDATHGRGLDMVTMLAAHLEATSDEDGHAITAELLVMPDEAHQPNRRHPHQNHA